MVAHAFIADSQHPLNPGAPFVKGSLVQPVALPQGVGEAQAEGAAPALEVALQGGAQVVGLRLQCGQTLFALPAVQPGPVPLGQRQKVIRMGVAGLFMQRVRRQQIKAEMADGLQQVVAASARAGLPGHHQ